MPTTEDSTTTSSIAYSEKTKSQKTWMARRRPPSPSKTSSTNSSNSLAVDVRRPRSLRKSWCRRSPSPPLQLPSFDQVWFPELQDPWTSIKLRKRVYAGIVVSNTSLFHKTEGAGHLQGPEPSSQHHARYYQRSR